MLSSSNIANRYVLQESLGTGGMGAVYRVKDRLSGQTLALKQIWNTAESLVFNSLSDTEDNSVLLAHEFQTLASLRHPHIVNVLDYGFDHDMRPYFTMALIERPRTILSVAQEAELSGQLRLIVQMLLALAYLHQRGIIHRDIKPENVMVDDADQVRLVDFGLAMRPSESRSVAGTLAYMAPEVLRGEGATIASDLYAVGIIIYEIFTGNYPYPYDSVSELISKILTEAPDLSDLEYLRLSLSDIEMPSVALAGVINRLLEKDPADRYDSAATVIADICRICDFPMPPETDEIRESFLHTATFVGRDAELQHLRKALDACGDQHGSIWLIGGESGVGKSRLLNELRVRALVQGVLVLRGQAVSDGGLSYQVWREPARHLVLSTELSDLEAGVLKELVSDIDQLLGRPIPVPPKMDDRLHQQRLVYTLASLFRRQSQPVLLILEDLQWAAGSLEPLRFINTMIGETSLMVAASYRDDEWPDLPEVLPPMNYIHLKRFAPEVITEMIEAILGETGRREEVVQLLNRETEGNAYFLVETVRALAEEAGGLGEIGTRTLPASIINGGVLQVLRRRLGRVPEQYQPLLHLAAVIGRDVDKGLMKFLMADDEQLLDDSWLNSAANASVFEVNGDKWRFAHDKLRETLLADLSVEVRRSLYRQVAEAVETVYADQLEDRSVILLHYWTGAEDQSKQAYYSLMAARFTEKMGALPEAKRLFQQALTLEAHTQMDNPDKALAELFLDLGRINYRTSDYPAARRWQMQSMELFQALDDARGIAGCYALLAETDIRQGKAAESVDMILKSKALYEQLDDQLHVGYALLNLGLAHAMQGETILARDKFQESYDVLLEFGEPIDQCRALNNLGIIYDFLGELEQALALHQRTLQTRREIGDRIGVAYSLLNLAAVYGLLDRFDEGLACTREGEVLLREVDDRFGLSNLLQVTGDFYMQKKDYVQAEVAFRECLAIREALGNKEDLASAWRNMGHVLHKLGQWSVAYRHFLQAMQLERERDAHNRLYHQCLTYAEVFIDEGHLELAAQTLSTLSVEVGDQPEFVRKLLATLKAQLPPEIVEQHLENGPVLTLDKTIDRIFTFFNEKVF